MNSQYLFRSLAIALREDLILKERLSLIESDIALEKVVSSFFLDKAEKTLKYVLDNNIGLLFYSDDCFPRFDNLNLNLPYVLFYQGKRPEYKKENITVLGSTQCDYQGFMKAREFSEKLCSMSYNVVTDLDIGINQSVVSGCISSKKGCICVCACGLDSLFPKSSYLLKEQVLENNGTLVSPFYPDMQFTKYNFQKRSLIESSYSDSLIVIQSSEQSSALNAVDYALDMSKDVYVTNYGLGFGSSRKGSNLLFEEGASLINI